MGGTQFGVRAIANIPPMQNLIFHIAFEYDGAAYTGWVESSLQMDESSKLVSFSTVLNDISFGYLFYHGNVGEASFAFD